MNCDENQSPEETKNHIQSPLIEPNNADAEMYQNPNNPVNANIFHHINFYKKPPQRHKQGTFSPSFPSKRIKSNHDHVSVNGNNDNNNINSNSNNEGNNSNINIITHNANFSEPQKDNFDNLNNATNYSLNHVKRLSKSPRPIETTNNQPNIITIPHSLVINDSASNSNTPPTPSKKRRVLDMANTKNERYDKCTVVRRGDLACIYHVIEKVSNRVCYFVLWKWLLSLIFIRNCVSKKLPPPKPAKNMNLRKN